MTIFYIVLKLKKIIFQSAVVSVNLYKALELVMQLVSSSPSLSSSSSLSTSCSFSVLTSVIYHNILKGRCSVHVLVPFFNFVNILQLFLCSAILSYPHLYRNDPLAQQLGPVYGLTPEVHAVVGVVMGEGEVHIFPQGNSTRASLKAWLTALREGYSTPSGRLISGPCVISGLFKYQSSCISISSSYD